jgi:hypothetical protein
VRSGHADAALIGKVTQHWFRHRHYTPCYVGISTQMEQGGSLDVRRSVIGYSDDVPEYRRQPVTEMDDAAMRPRKER